MGKSFQLKIKNETFELLPEKAVYWVERKTLLVADLHWGKAETFQRAGIPVSSEVLVTDLEILSRCLIERDVRRLFILGDLIHHPTGIVPMVVETIAQWRATFRGEIRVVEGNHDRRWKGLPESWGMELSREGFAEAGFWFGHEPYERPDHFVWCGHVHPMARLGRISDRLRLPCFAISTHLGILPSFSFFTRGQTVTATTNTSLYAITEDSVHALPRPF